MYSIASFFVTTVLRAAFALLALSLPCAAHAAAVAAAAPLATARVNHSATQLTNGKLLVVGGQNGTGTPLTNVETYDPFANVWSAGTALAAARSDHTATLLDNGRVLIVGGRSTSANAALATALLYDPSTNAWLNAGSLAAARSSHTAARLPSGKVLVVGGQHNGAVLASAEIYDPATNAWTSAGALTTARFRHTATAVNAATGANAVVVIGGSNDPGSQLGQLGTIETYNATSNTWSVLTATLNPARHSHSATLLHNGKLLIAGGTRFASSGINVFPQSTNTAELLDMTLAAPTLANASPMPNARSDHSATLSPSRNVMVAGGINVTQFSSSYNDQIASYDPTSNSWVAEPDMPHNRANHTASLLLTGAVLLVGGATNAGAVTAATVIVRVANFGNGSVSGSSACIGFSGLALTQLPDGTLLSTGGSPSGASSSGADVLRIDPTTRTCTSLTPLAAPRSFHTATLLPSGSVLLAGGRLSGIFKTNSAELYDPSVGPSGSTVASLSMAQSRKFHTSTLLSDGRVFIAGGLGDFNTPVNADDPPEIFDPATNAFSTTAFTNVPRRVAHAAALLPGGDVLLLAGTSQSNCSGPSRGWSRYNIASGTVTHGALNVGRCRATAIVLPSGKVLLAGGEAAVSQVPLNTVEIFDPVTNTAVIAPSLSTAGLPTMAAMLPTGEVLISVDASSTTEIFDPVANTWRPGPVMTVGRVGSQATTALAKNGTVVIHNGISYTQPTSATEFIPLNLAPVAAHQPTLTTVTTSFTPNTALSATGTRFRPALQVSGGDTQQSASNAPVFELHRIDNDQRVFLPQAAVTFIGSSPFTDTSFVSAVGVTAGFPSGHARLRAWVNGVPSDEKMVLVAVKPYQPSAPTAAVTSVTTATVTFATAPFFNGGSALTKYGVETESGATVGSCNMPCTSIVATGLTPGSTYRFRAFAANAVGEGARSPLSNSITLPLRGSTTSVVSSVNPSVYAQAVTFTATIMVAGGAALAGGGTVSFSANGNPIAGCGAVPVTLVASNNVATCSTSVLPASASNYTINAFFSGDAQTSFSSAQWIQTVNKAEQAITNARWVTSGDVVISAATVGMSSFVTAAPGASSQPLVFSTSSASAGICTIAASLAPNTASTAPVAVGTCTALIDQAGDANYNAAPQVSVSIPVLNAPIVTLSGVPLSIYVGQFARITVTVTGVAPTGTVSASVDSIAFLSAIGCTNMPLQGTGNTRSASCLLRGVAEGIHSGLVKSSYSGDANYVAADGSSVDEPDVLATPSLNIDLSPAPGTAHDAATDGVMILRYLAGFSGTAITQNAMHPSFDRSPQDVPRYLALIRATLDVNADDQLDLATDGLLIVRYMRGLRIATGLFSGINVGTALTQGQIEAYLALLMP